MRLYDKEIRKLLLNQILTIEEYVEDPSCIIVNEMDICFGCARIDLAVINGQMHGYEIKSDYDNLERLPSQADYYNRVFESLTLVVSEKHFTKAVEIIPEWWGIYCVTTEYNRASLNIVRSPKPNINIDVASIAQLLWKDELYELLKKRGITKGVKSKTRYELSKIVEKQLVPSDICEFTRQKLKQRTSSRALQLQQLYGDWHQLQPN